jgi:aerobic-type carbon monoxide dehydrogenase small subunit (CoxS/CutS family)
MAEVVLRVNGDQVPLDVRNDETLLESLRERVETSSVRYACGIGVCGSCTVLLDGRPASSCLLLTTMVGDRYVVTAEAATTESAAGTDAELGCRVQGAFVDARAYQCSYCIPAMALTVQGLLATQPDATAEQIADQLGGNLCRCGTYPDVLAAVERVIGSSDRGKR